MPDEVRTVCYDRCLSVEAYRLQGVIQKFPNHFHDYYVVGFVEKSRRYLTCKNRDYVISPGDIILFNPGDSHTCSQLGTQPLDYRCLNIQPDVMKKTAAEITGKEYLPVFERNVLYRSDLAGPLKELHRRILAKDADFRKEELYLLLMGQLLRESSGCSAQDAEPTTAAGIELAAGYLEEHYSEPVPLDELSRVAGMSKYHLIRTFSVQKGITPYSFLESVRINHAKKLLEQGTSPADAALETGFGDQSHFTNYFKKLIGLTPSQYRAIFMPENGWEKQEGFF